MNGQTVVDNVRLLLKDNFSDARWTDSEMIKWLNEGRFMLVRKRPDALYTDDVVPTTNTLVPITALTDDLLINVFMTEALVNFVCYRCLMKDSEDVKNQKLAIGYKQLCEGILNGSS